MPIPVVPHSRTGSIGRTGFIRLPNHYRSVSFVLPADPGGGQRSPGVIVFKGTEPLIPDFAEYLDWMLGAPFRASALPLALHFPLDMKLPPAAMWIEECRAEQAVSSALQQMFLGRFGRLARVPVPLFAFKLSAEQNARYEELVRSRIPDDGIRKIRNKLVDGLGVEVYFYPELPVRVADLSIANVREAFKAALGREQTEEVFDSWTQLFAGMLCLGYMPYAPWHHGMGGCVDPGNVCIDGGFNDLLTLVPFDAIPDDLLFRHSLAASIKMLAESMVGMAVACIGVPPLQDGDAVLLATAYVGRKLQEHLLCIGQDGRGIDARLRRYFAAAEVSDIVELVRRAHQSRIRSTQFARAELHTAPLAPAQDPARGGWRRWLLIPSAWRCQTGGSSRVAPPAWSERPAT